MNYTKLGEFVESLMKSVVKGEIDEKEFVQLVDEKISDLKKVSE
ncbi:hypothetical protein [Alkalibacillus silvisoli]|uniref:Uncharacterized protein n=1 Tax=Alkalibacillus silvisoli TaxID=392823 RepID=A0ABN1AAP4_9BACI